MIYVVDSSTNEVIKKIPIEGLPEHLIYNPSNDYVYVTSIMNETGIVSIIDSSTNNIVKNIPVGSPDFTSDRKINL